MTRDLIGQQLGSYRLVSLLGSGGFAEVYLGQHVRLSSMQAAIKVLHTHLSPEKINEFQQEADTIAKLEHPHIVHVRDFDVSDDTPFLVMDYCPHGTLRQRHPKGKCVPLSTVVSYIQQVAKALQYAHDQKLIHRDVKPENILIGRHDDILLSDFGIAATAHNTSTMSTQVPVGTIPYMAPEQIHAQARPASDQYALGIVTYEWLCGERPFEGSYTEIFAKQLMTPPPPLLPKVPTLPPDVEQVILTALAKDPHQRFATVQAFATALEQASQTKQPVPASTQLDRVSSQLNSPLESTVPAQPVKPDRQTGTQPPVARSAAPEPPSSLSSIQEEALPVLPSEPAPEQPSSSSPAQEEASLLPPSEPAPEQPSSSSSVPQPKVRPSIQEQPHSARPVPLRKRIVSAITLAIVFAILGAGLEGLLGALGVLKGLILLQTGQATFAIFGLILGGASGRWLEPQKDSSGWVGAGVGFFIGVSLLGPAGAAIGGITGEAIGGTIGAAIGAAILGAISGSILGGLILEVAIKYFNNNN